MTTMYVTEYAQSGYTSQGNVPVGYEPGFDQPPVTISGTSAQSLAFKNNTTMVRIHVDSIASIVFGLNPTAVANTNKRLAANQTEYFFVPQTQGYKVAVVTST